MRFVLLTAAKDLRRRLADPAALLIWIGIPLAIGGLFSLIGGGSGAAPRAKVLVVDQDDTVLSRFLAGSGGRGGVGEFLDLEPVALEDGRRRIDAGEATALLILPDGLQDAIVQEKPAKLVLVTNPAQRILPGIVEEGLEILVEAAFYAQRLFGPTVRRIVRARPEPGSPSNAEVAAISIEINERIRQLDGVLFPPVLDLKTEREEPRAGSSLSFGQLFVPGLLFMSIMFVAQGMSVDVWMERTKGTLRRALSAPHSPRCLLAGKLAAGVVFITGIALVALLASISLFDVAWRRVPLAVLWCGFAGGALLSLFTVLQMAAASERGGHLLSSIVIFPLIMIGGSFFPFEAMPAWMAAIGTWTPNGQAVVRLKDLLFGEPHAGALLFAAAAIGAPALVAFELTARVLRGRFATG